MPPSRWSRKPIRHGGRPFRELGFHLQALRSRFTTCLCLFRRSFSKHGVFLCVFLFSQFYSMSTSRSVHMVGYGGAIWRSPDVWLVGFHSLEYPQETRSRAMDRCRGISVPKFSMWLAIPRERRERRGGKESGKKSIDENGRRVFGVCRWMDLMWEGSEEDGEI